MFLVSLCSQFFAPARLALIGDIVEEPQRARATGLEQATQSFTSILGSPLAAPLFFIFGIQWALLINALSFGLSFLLLAAMRIPTSFQDVKAEQVGKFGLEFRQGLRFAFGHRVIRSLIIGVFITMLGGGAFNALIVFFFLENLHAPAVLVGSMDAIFGIGIIGGAIITGLFAQRIGLERTFSWAVLVVGIIFVTLARMTNLISAIGLIALLGICQAAIGVAVGPLLLKVTPRELIGRISAILDPSATIASFIAISLAGYMASVVLANLHTTVLGIPIGPIDTIFTGAGILVIIAGLYLLKKL